jgi:argininosuccinate synthase
MSAPKKVVLAYSGGLDTSIILKWLQTEYGCEVVTFTADLGQGEELEPARAKAVLLGIDPKNIHIRDVREEFVRDFVFPMFRANAVYEGLYLLGTSIARPLIAKHLIEIAAATGADAVAHGATGKGNDQVRFELSASPRTSAAKRRSASTPICCTHRPRAKCWRTRRRKRRIMCISARLIR